MKRLNDPLATSVVALTALAVVGLIVLALAWRGVAAEVDVATQVPFLVSGGIGALALIGFACGLLTIQHRRFVEARHRAELNEVAAAAAAAVTALRQEREDTER